MTGPDQRQIITFEGCTILYRNFSGVPGKFNEAGDRNFNVVLDEKTAKAMEKDGWNVKWQPPYNEEDPQRPILKVNVKYRDRTGKPVKAPRVLLITGKGKTVLEESMLPILDWATIVNVDISIVPYNYTAMGRSGISAYLRSIYVTIEDDPLEEKYGDVPDSAQNTIVTEPHDPEAPF
jgi:hypothetical protein